MDLNFAGKAVIVTGGGSNIGRAIALTIAKEGANVVIADLDIAQGEKVAAQANALKAGGRSIAVKTNVTRCPVFNDRNMDWWCNICRREIIFTHYASLASALGFLVVFSSRHCPPPPLKL